MSTLHGRSRVEPDGTLRIPLPPSVANSEVEYVLDFQATGGAGVGGAGGAGGEGKNGAGDSPPTSRPAPAPESIRERRKLLDKVIGTIDDPTFVRPPQGEWPGRESLD